MQLRVQAFPSDVILGIQRSLASPLYQSAQSAAFDHYGKRERRFQHTLVELVVVWVAEWMVLEWVEWMVLELVFLVWVVLELVFLVWVVAVLVVIDSWVLVVVDSWVSVALSIRLVLTIVVLVSSWYYSSYLRLFVS